MKKLLHIRIDSPFYNSDGMMKGFAENGYEYWGFDWQRERFSSGTEKMHEKVLGIIEEHKFDYVFLHCQNPDAFTEEVIKRMAANSMIINYTFDVREDIGWYKKVAPHCLLTIFACEEDVEACKLVGINNVARMHSSCDFDMYKPSLAKRIDVPDIVFIGNNYAKRQPSFPRGVERQDMIEFMEENFGDKFMAYGDGQRGGHVSQGKEIDIYNSCKIAITHNLYSRTCYTSDRTWRAIATGAFTIQHAYMPFTADLGFKIASWTDFNDLIYNCKYFLSHDEERNAIANYTTAHIRDHHGWKNRIHQMNQLIEKLCQSQKLS